METANNKAVRPHPGRHRNGARAELARLCVAVSCVSLGLIAAGASAERVLAPYHITATACGTFPEGSPGYWSLDHLYNGDGLAGTGDATTHITDWRNGSAPGEDGYHWTCGGTYGGHSGREGPFNPHPGTVAGQQWVAFRFDHPYALAKIRIWNHQVYFLSQYGFRDTYVQYSASGGSNPAEWTTLWHGELPQGGTAPDPSPPVPASVILDAHGAVAQYVCITSTDAWGPNVYGGLTEVQFTCVSGPGPVLDITVGARTKLSDLQYENQNVVSVSRTGTVAAFYQKPNGVRYYRTSADRGVTWGPEAPFSPYPGSMSAGLAAGGVVAMTGQATPAGGGNPPVASNLESTRILYSDDFTQYSTSLAAVFLPNAVQHTKWATFWPVWDKGKIVRLDNGDLLALMYGNLQGDNNWYRTMVLRSADEGRSWQYRSTVAYSSTDPDPELPGQYCGYCEPSMTLLANGQLLCLMRTQGSQFAPYRTMYAAWSDDLALTWTAPAPTSPPLLNVWPTVQTLDNGVVAAAYGRPGVNVAFSADNGHTWSEIVNFSTAGEPSLTGYADMVKVGPNDLVMIAGLEGGTYVYPIRVRLDIPSPSSTTLIVR